jgi:hypothetical protein
MFLKKIQKKVASLEATFESIFERYFLFDDIVFFEYFLDGF